VAVPRIGRLLDAAAAVLLLAGGALYARSYYGLEELRDRPPGAYSAGMEITRLAEFHALNRVSWAGVAVALIGVGVAVYAALLARKLRVA
jgi:hypothetical protein